MSKCLTRACGGVWQSFDGDLFQGLGSIVGEFHQETATALERVHFELQMLYAVYVLVVRSDPNLLMTPQS